MTPRITFITPTYNAGATIEDTIRSVEKEASCFDFEHRFIDGGSSDDTLSAITRLKGSSALLTSEPDNGPYDAMNKGVAQAIGEWVAIINADDYYLPGAVEAIMKVADASPSAGVVYGDMIVDHPHGSMRVTPGLGWRGRLGIQHPICHPAMFAKRTVYERLGTYDVRYRLAADQHFFFRLLDGNEQLRYVPEAITLMRAGGLSGQRYDIGTLELLDIHRSRRNIAGALSQLLFYAQPRLKTHAECPQTFLYWGWAAQDFLRSRFGVRQPLGATRSEIRRPTNSAGK